jgi:hypothetical protein
MRFLRRDALSTASTALTMLLLLSLSNSACKKREGSRASLEKVCENNMVTMRRLMKAYENEHGELRRVADGPNGTKHSWRMLIAQYLLEEDPF